MISNCCNGDCNQGRACPARAKRGQPSFRAMLLILAVSWIIAAALAVTIESAGGKIARAQIHTTSCGAC